MTLQDETLRLKFDNSYNGRLFAVQGDTGRTYNLQILSDMNNILDVSGMNLRLYIGTDKEVSYTDGEITSAEEGKFKVQVYNSQLKYPGLQKAQFVLTDKDGKKVGSKVFDLYVEEGLEVGPTLGKNILVDFETIDEALKLIRNYDKTLEEAKEVDLKLKVDIQEGTETREALSDCKKKALEIKDQLDTSKTDAGKTLQDLKTTKTESESLKTDLESENTKADKSIQALTEKTEAGNKTITGLDQSTNTAKTTKESLDISNTAALSTEKSLLETTSIANHTKESLETLKSQGDTLAVDLSSNITSGNFLKADLNKSIGAASTSKSNLDASIDKAVQTDSALKSTDTEARGTEELLRDLLAQIGATKGEVQQIIASGDLSKYVTDPKLQKALTNYAKLENGEVPVENLPTMGDGNAGIVPAKNGKFLSIFADELKDMPTDGPYIITKTPLQGGRIRLRPIQELPDGGTTGQVLKKTETGAEWKDEQDLSGYVKTSEAKTLIKKFVKEEAIQKTMTAVIDQSNSNPLTCITYENDARMMEKGSAEWDKFFGTKLVLFKGGKEVRELKDSELNGLKPEDGDVMVKFKRMGLNIKTVGDKIYVSMTNDPDDESFKYYAHTRGGERKEAFYLGAYLGYEEAGKLRSIKGHEPTGNKIIGDFRTIAQANGQGYDQLAFYQWTFIQAMFILKYGSLDSQTALGRGLTKNSTFLNTGGTNGKGIDFGTANGTDQMRFQYLEDLWGNKTQWCDGVQSGGNSDMTTATDNFSNDRTGYKSRPLGFSGNVYQYPKKIQGTSELGFIMKENGASQTTYYCDYQNVHGNSAFSAVVGGTRGYGNYAGAFCFDCQYPNSSSSSAFGARLMYL